MLSGSDYFYYLDGASDVGTASNISFEEILKTFLQVSEDFVETRTVHFARFKSSSRFDRVNKLDTELLALENVMTCFSPEMPFVIVFIPSDLRRARKCWVS